MPQAATELCFASALSDHGRTAEAVRAVCDQLGEAIAAPVDLAVVFFTGHHVDQLDLLRDTIRERINPRVILGVSAEGVLGHAGGQDREIERQPGLSVLAASLPGVTLTPFSYSQIDWNEALTDAASLRRQMGLLETDPAALLLLADPFSTPIGRLLQVLDDAFEAVPVIGGMASSGHMPNQNRLLLDDRMASEGAVGVAISGRVRVDAVVSQGCRPIGRPMVITQAKRNVVQQFGGRNALACIQQMAGELSEHDRDLIQKNGLLVGRVINEYKARFGRGDFLVRALVGVDQEQGYLAIGDAKVRVGQTVQFHVRDAATAREDLELLLDAQALHGPADAALLFSCNGRGERLFDQPHVDAATVGRALGPLPLAGFFAAGEIGPIAGQNHLHGHTIALAVLRRPDAVEADT
jgi:small ligand-binding sensory domain FIST